MVSPVKNTLIAKRLKNARERLNISQMELGVRAGIDEFSASARINQYERGKHAPDFNTAKSLAKVLGLPTAYFYCEEEDLADLIAIYGTLSTANKKTILQHAKNL
ncbi:MAG: helix-turn-helix domain-containing protein [Legionellales bacterium]